MLKFNESFTDTFYVRDSEYRVNPHPKHFGQSRRITCVRTINADQTVTRHVVFVHQCLDWRKVRTYDVSSDAEFYALLNLLATKTQDRDFGYHPQDRFMDRTDWHYDFWIER
jgi:hypothetical protein